MVGTASAASTAPLGRRASRQMMTMTALSEAAGIVDAGNASQRALLW
jgi:hypothetical protein